MVTIVLYMVLVAIVWGIYPLIIRSVGVSGVTGALILTVSSLIPIAMAAIYNRVVMPGMLVTLKIAMAGIIMGVSLVIFFKIVSSPLMDISASIPIINALVILVAAIGGVCLFGEAVTASKILGICLLIL